MAETIKNTNVFPRTVNDVVYGEKFVDFDGLDYFWGKAKAYVDAEDVALGKRIDDVVGDLDELTAIVNSMNGTEGSGTIADRIQAAIEGLKLDETYAGKAATEQAIADAKDAAIADANGYTDDAVAGLKTDLEGQLTEGVQDAKNYSDGKLAEAIGVAASEGVEATGLRKEIADAVAAVGSAGNEYADGLNDAMDARVKVLEAIDHDQLAADAAASAVATVVGNAPEAFDTLKEIADWIQKDAANENGFDAAARIVALENNKADKSYVDDQDVALAARIKALEDVKDAYVEADNTLATTLRGEIATAKGEAVTSANGYTDEKVGALAGTVDTLTGTVASNLTEAKSYADGVAATAKSEAIADADSKLANYSTTAQMTEAIRLAKEAAIADAQGKIDSLTTTVNKKADTTYVDEKDAEVLASAKAYASTYTDQLFDSIKFVTNADIDAIFA